MGKKEDKSNSEKKRPEKERRFSQEQYDMLKRCSEKKDMTEWNDWCEEDPDEEIWLERADLRDAHLENAKLWDAHLEGADLWEANMKGADLKNANLKGVHLCLAHLENADLWLANLEGANLWAANMKGAYLKNANLEGAFLVEANLQGANFNMANLEGAKLRLANLEGAKLVAAIVNGSTSLWGCEIDENTDFRHTGLENTRIESGTKILLKYNIRRMNWKDWYAEHRFLQWPVRVFWWMSDYGRSTLRVVGVFFLLAFLFAGVYLNWAYLRPPGIVSNLDVQPEIGEAWLHYCLRAPVRPVYFSIVTMTTLGFGDMYANKGSIAGHVILCVQVILGYVLLGALITRFAVLFTAGGPAGKFAKQVSAE